jgi:hypothetical protein
MREPDTQKQDVWFSRASSLRMTLSTISSLATGD